MEDPVYYRLVYDLAIRLYYKYSKDQDLKTPLYSQTSIIRDKYLKDAKEIMELLGYDKISR